MMFVVVFCIYAPKNVGCGEEIIFRKAIFNISVVKNYGFGLVFSSKFFREPLNKRLYGEP